VSEDAPYYGPMTEQRARDLIDKCVIDGNFFSWPAYGDDPDHAQLDGEFTAEELEAIAWWMRNQKPA
jgi:hypothetical protein